MTENAQTTSTSSWKSSLAHRVAELRQREGQIFLVLALVIGALTGLAVVTFIMLTERLGMRLYPADGAPWRINEALSASSIVRVWSAKLRKTLIRSSVISWMRWLFHTPTRTMGLIWRSSAWGRIRLKSCRW